MEREGIEKTGIGGLISGIEAMRAGSRKILRKEGAERRWRKVKSPTRKTDDSMLHPPISSRYP